MIAGFGIEVPPKFLYDLQMGDTKIEVQAQGPVVIFTFVPPPEGLATLKKTTLLEFEKAMQAHRQARVFVLTGVGKGFVCGADIAEMEKMTPAEAKDFALTGQRVMRILELSPQVILCAVNGYALGGGCELALACDIRIAASTAKFAQPELNLGIPPGWAGTQRLPRLIGLSRAKELILTGRSLKAQEAFEIGLVHAVVEPERLMDTALREAKRFLDISPNAIALAKRAFAAGDDRAFEQGSMHEDQCFEEAFAHADQKEGMRAFLEKRKPRYA